jgi:hypothetical protein
MTAPRSSSSRSQRAWPPGDVAHQPVFRDLGDPHSAACAAALTATTTVGCARDGSPPVTGQAPMHSIGPSTCVAATEPDDSASLPNTSDEPCLRWPPRPPNWRASLATLDAGSRHTPRWASTRRAPALSSGRQPAGQPEGPGDPAIGK